MHPVQTLFSAPHSRDEIAVSQRLPAVPAPQPYPAPRHSHPDCPCPCPRGHSGVPEAPCATLTWSGLPWLGSHSPASQVHQRARPAGSLRPRCAQHWPEPSAILPDRHCAPGRRSPQLRVLSTAPPPASARAEPDGHPGTGGRRASRTSLEPGDRRWPPPRGTVGSPETKGRVRAARRGVPAPGSPALQGRCARRSAPPEVPELAGTPPQAARWYGPPPFKGSALRCHYLQLRRVQTRTAETPGAPAPGAPARTSGSCCRGDVPGVGAPDHRPRCFWPPLWGLPSKTSGIRMQPFFNFAFSFEKCPETSVYTTTSLLGHRRQPSREVL